MMDFRVFLEIFYCGDVWWHYHVKQVEITVTVMRYFRHYRNSYDERTVLDALYVI